MRYWALAWSFFIVTGSIMTLEDLRRRGDGTVSEINGFQIPFEQRSRAYPSVTAGLFHGKPAAPVCSIRGRASVERHSPSGVRITTTGLVNQRLGGRGVRRGFKRFSNNQQLFLSEGDTPRL